MKLDSKNRWVKLGMELPWDEMVRPYLNRLSKDKGAGAKDARVIVGSLYIKHHCNLSEEETIQQIQENPYMQYFLGLNTYHPDPLFDPSLFVTIRKRMGPEEYDKMDRAIREKVKGIEESKGEKGTAKEIKNKGELKIDATVADQYIKYPTDLDLLPQCQVWTETIIDEIFPKALLDKKP